MNLIKTNNEKQHAKHLLGVLAVGLALSLVLGLAVVRSYSVGSGPQNTTQNGDINVTNNYSGELQDAPRMVGAVVSSLVDPNHLNAGEWTQLNDLWLDDVEIDDDLWVAGDIQTSGTVNFVYGYNVASTSIASGTSTPSAIQNTSGFDRVIPYASLDINAGSSADNIARLVRAYVSFNRAGTTTTDVIREISLATSTARTTIFTTTTLGVIWRNDYWLNVTSTDVNSSTGQLKASWFQF